jgi:hypothetical protein
MLRESSGGLYRTFESMTSNRGLTESTPFPELFFPISKPRDPCRPPGQLFIPLLQHGLAISLPHTLTCLHLSTKIEDTVQFISVLPRSIVDLSLVYSFHDNYDDDAHVSFLRSLPRGLTRLRTRFVHRTQPTLKPWSDEELDALPRTLTDVDILRAKGFHPHQSIGTLLPNLKEIPIGVPFNALKVLPSSLTELSQRWRTLSSSLHYALSRASKCL